jgi:hypothetical protein
MAPWWVPVVSLIVGLLGGYLADALRDSRAAAREEAAADRARVRERAAFERETLIELQDWLAKLMRAMGAMHHHDYMEYRKSGRWGHDPVGEDLNTGFHEAIVNVHRYRVRAADADVRDMAQRIVTLAVAATWGATHGQDDSRAYARANTAYDEIGGDYGQAQERIGERLRVLA